MKRYALAAALAAGLLLTGCSNDDDMDGTTTQASSMGAINDACPFSGNPIDGSSSAQYKGHEIGFCCGDCVGSWNKMSDDDKNAAITKMTN